LLSLSDPTTEPDCDSDDESRNPARGPAQLTADTMRYIEPHGHMVSRTTRLSRHGYGGFVRSVRTGVWPGSIADSVQGFYDYFCQLTEHEPKAG